MEDSGRGPVERLRALVRAWPLLRFALAGAAGNVTHALVFLVLAALAPVLLVLVNVLATVVSTAVTSELHRRFTFRAAARSAWFTGHGVGGAAAATGLVLSSTALAGWHHLAPGAGALSGVVVVQSVTGLVGLANFAVLRTLLRAPTPPA